MAAIKSVVLARAPGGWRVSVKENGRTVEQQYPNEQFARSYADGQAYRLGVVVAEGSPFSPLTRQTKGPPGL
jgi:hypothetical protein